MSLAGFLKSEARRTHSRPRRVLSSSFPFLAEEVEDGQRGIFSLSLKQAQAIESGISDAVSEANFEQRCRTYFPAPEHFPGREERL